MLGTNESSHWPYRKTKLDETARPRTVRGVERISSPKNQMDFQPTHVLSLWTDFWPWWYIFFQKKGLIRPKDARRAFLLPADGKYCFRYRSHKWPNSKRIQHSQPPECPIESLYTSKHQSTRTWHSMYPRLQVWNIQIVKQKTFSVSEKQDHTLHAGRPYLQHRNIASFLWTCFCSLFQGHWHHSDPSQLSRVKGRMKMIRIFQSWHH